eukprot:gene9107-10556_t
MFAEEAPSMGAMQGLWPTEEVHRMNLLYSRTSASSSSSKCRELPDNEHASKLLQQQLAASAGAGHAPADSRSAHAAHAHLTAGSAHSNKSLTDYMYTQPEYKYTEAKKDELYGDIFGLDMVADPFGFEDAASNLFVGGLASRRQRQTSVPQQQVSPDSYNQLSRMLKTSPAQTQTQTQTQNQTQTQTQNSATAAAAETAMLEIDQLVLSTFGTAANSPAPLSSNQHKVTASEKDYFCGGCGCGGGGGGGGGGGSPKEEQGFVQDQCEVDALKPSRRAVGNPSDFGGLSDDAICNLDFDELGKRISMLKGPLKTKIKERRKQLKNRIHAKRAAAKREKRANKKEAENDVLQAKAAHLIKENTELQIESDLLQLQKLEIDTSLQSHHQEMNALRTQLDEMKFMMEKVEQASEADAGAGAGAGADRGDGGGGGGGGGTLVPNPLSTTLPSESVDYAHWRPLRCGGGGSIAGSDFGVAVPDALLSSASLDLGVSLNQLALDLNTAWSAGCGDTASSASCGCAKHKIDDESPDPVAKSGKRIRLLKPA